MRKIGNILFKTLGIILFATASTTYAQDARLTAKVSKRKMAVNQRFRVEYEINKQDADNFKLPNMADFKVIQGPSQSVSSSYSFVNGRAKSIFSKKYTYVLQPKRKGVLTLAPATIEYDGNTIKSNSISIQVLNAVDLPKDPNDPSYIANENVHLITTISKNDIYVGEPTYVEYRLYVNDVAISNYNVEELGNFEGFWSQNFEDENIQAKQGEYKGQPSKYYVLKRALLIPQRSGELFINPMEVSLTVGVPTGRGDFWGNAITRNVNMTFKSKKRTLKVKSLPTAGKPANFSGAVGNFDLKVNSSRTTFKANESAQIKVSINGKGNLKLFEIPTLEAPSEIEIYEPEQKKKVTTYTSGLSGSVTNSYTIVPQYNGEFTIPEVNFSYFNPKDSKYYSISSKPITLSIEGGKQIVTNTDTDQTPGVIKQKVTGVDTGLRFIQTKTNLKPTTSSNFLGSTSYYLLLILAFVSVPLAIIIGRKQAQLSNDVKRNKVKKADKLTKKHLATAKKELGNKDTFYTALEKALHNYLKAKLQVETSEISKDKIRELLSSRNASESSIVEFTKVLEACEFARYTPSSDEKMNEDFELAKSSITQLDKNL